MKRIKVRFNLGAGENYMKWKIDIPGQDARYLDPQGVQLRMTGCTLRNSPATAAKIHAGANKSVCAWILCDQISILSAELESPSITQLKNFEPLAYNPRVQPNWLCCGTNVDGESYDNIISMGKTLFVELKNNS
jgi:hypothetical protein